VKLFLAPGGTHLERFMNPLTPLCSLSWSGVRLNERQRAKFRGDIAHEFGFLRFRKSAIDHV